MATQSEYGLFGPTPEQVAQMEQQRIAQDAAAFAQMDPDSRASAAMYRAGASLVGPVMGMFGYTHKPTDQARQRQEVVRGVDINTPEGLMEAARRFNELGMPQEARAAADRARQLQEEQVNRDYKRSLTDKASRDTELMRMMEIVANPDEYSPAEVKVAQDYLAAKNARTAGGSGGGGTPRMVDSTIGLIVFNPSDRSFYMPGSSTPLTPEQMQGVAIKGTDPAAAGALAASKRQGGELGAASGKALAAIPGQESLILIAQDLGEKLFAHPGYRQAVGAGIKFATAITASDAKGADAIYEQLKGQQFLQGIAAMKGTGSVSNAEGLAAEKAMGRMDSALNERDFVDAYNDFIYQMHTGLEKMRKVAGLAPVPVNLRPMVASTMIAPPQRGDAPITRSVTSAPVTSTRSVPAAGTSGSGYNGGTRSAADADRLMILEDELRRAVAAGRTADAADVRREIARLKVPSGRPATPSPKQFKRPANFTDKMWEDYKKATGVR